MTIIEIKKLTKTFGRIQAVRGRPNLQKQGAMKIAGRIIPHQRGKMV
jgi:hypothetical protein